DANATSISRWAVRRFWACRSKGRPASGRRSDSTSRMPTSSMPRAGGVCRSGLGRNVDPMLAITGLEKRYHAKAALLGIDLVVADDEIVALLGPTGAGKTSTLLCVSGLERADAGRIEIDGED